MTRETTQVVFVLVVLLVAIAIALATGGHLSNLGHLPIRHPSLVVAAVAVQLLGGLVGGRSYAVGLAGSVLLVGGFLLQNRRIEGTTLVALGLLSNALVVGLNGAMPVSAHASGRAGISIHDLVAGTDPRHELADESTRLRPASDVIPVLLPLHPEVVSAGDVLIAAGLAQLVVVGMRRRPAEPVAG